MKYQLLRKLGICCLSASMIAGGGFMNQLQVKAQDDLNGVSVEIYPKAQAITYSSAEGMDVLQNVNVVLHGSQEEALLPKLKEMLIANKINYEITDEVNDAKSNIIISSDSTHCDVCESIESDALQHAEGYVLTSSNDTNPKGNVTIVGADSDGAYYGMLTLGQMLEQETNQKMAEATIEDYPEIAMRGYIEGFYGYPWTHQERMSLMHDTAKYKMNTYIYAPKDDPYHRANWKELYPEDKAQELAELAKAGRENNFNFCWTLHPGDSLNFSEADFQAAIKKLNQLYDLGVRQFGVLFDDINNNVNGQKHAEFINRIDTEFVKAKGDIKPMIVIGTRYCAAWGSGMLSYFKPFINTLHDDIQVMWTGAATMSNISKEVMEWPKQQIGSDRDLAVWWNYPVNDYCDGRLLTAPLHNLNPDLDNVTGFFSNPMQQADGSKVALYSIADYSWNTNDFTYMRSWERAIEELVPEESTAFKHFSEDSSYLKNDGGSSGPFIYDESWNSVALIDALKADITNNASIMNSSAALLDKYKTIIDDAASLQNLQNANLKAETAPFIGAYNALGEAGIHAMKALQAAEKNQLGIWLNEYDAAKQSLNEMETFKVTTMEDSGDVENTVAVGEQYLKPIVMTALDASNAIMSKNTISTKEIEVYDKNGAVAADIRTDKGHQFIENASTTLGFHESLTVALAKTSEVSNITLKANDLTNIKLQTSLNGLDWTDAVAELNDNTLTIHEKTTLTFIRIYNKSEESTNLTVDELHFTPVEVEKPNPTISHTTGTYENYYINNAIDGNMNTKYWGNSALSQGQYVQVNLGKSMRLYDVTGYFGTSDYISKGRFEISQDGITWESLGDLRYSLENDLQVSRIDAKGKIAQYFRYYVTESQGNWLQIYEIEMNKYTQDGGIVNLFETNMLGDVKQMADGDLTTAFAPESVVKDNYVSYKLTRMTKLASLSVLQSADSICNADVSIKKMDGTWQSIGKLDQQLSELLINDTAIEIKFTFDETQPLPIIYEMIPSELNIDKTALNEAIAAAEQLIQEADKYTSVYMNQLKAAHEEAKAIAAAPNATQAEVDAATDKLNDLVNNPILREDTTMVKAMLFSTISKAQSAIDSGQVDTLAPAVKALFNRYLAAARDVYDNKDATNQDVLKAWQNLAEIMQYLDFQADKTALNKLITECELIDTEDYTQGVEEFNNALANAQQVSADEKALQKRIDEAYSRLFSAKEGLKQDIVDKSVLKMFIDLANKAKEQADRYNPDSSWNEMLEALDQAQIVYDNKKATRAEVEAAAFKLAQAYENIRLLPNEKLLEQLRNYLEAVEGINRKNYTASAYNYMMETAAKARELLNSKDYTQAQADEMLNSIVKAYELMDSGKVEQPTVPGKPTKPNSKPTGTGTTNSNIKPSAKPDTSDASNTAGLLFMLGMAGAFTLISKKRLKDQ